MKCYKLPEKLKSNDNKEYYSKLQRAMVDTGFVGDEPIQLYSVAVKRADLRKKT